MLTVKLAKRAVSYLQISCKEKNMKTLSLSNGIFHKLTTESEEYGAVRTERSNPLTCWLN